MKSIKVLTPRKHPCPCNSGKKAKNCCQKSRDHLIEWRCRRKDILQPYVYRTHSAADLYKLVTMLGCDRKVLLSTVCTLAEAGVVEFKDIRITRKDLIDDAL